jgi:hypothetical protein
MGTLEISGSQTTTSPVDSALPSYRLTRSWASGIYDRLRYYPVPDAASVVLYESMSMTGNEGFRGQWFTVSPGADQVLRQVIADPPLSEAEQHSRWRRSGEASLVVMLLVALGAVTTQVARVRFRSGPKAAG